MAFKALIVILYIDVYSGTALDRWTMHAKGVAGTRETSYHLSALYLWSEKEDLPLQPRVLAAGVGSF